MNINSFPPRAFSRPLPKKSTLDPDECPNTHPAISPGGVSREVSGRKVVGFVSAKQPCVKIWSCQAVLSDLGCAKYCLACPDFHTWWFGYRKTINFATQSPPRFCYQTQTPPDAPRHIQKSQVFLTKTNHFPPRAFSRPLPRHFPGPRRVPKHTPGHFPGEVSWEASGRKTVGFASAKQHV